jgi:RNA polymerase sigma factor (TIGR02999 family)
MRHSIVKIAALLRLTRIRRILNSECPMSELTRILQSIPPGEAKAADELLPLVYEELRKLAAHKMAQEPPGHTLQPTALVHEAWLRLSRSEDVHWNSRAHFFGAAAEAMRRILVEAARRKRAQRRGGGRPKEDIDSIEVAASAIDAELVGLSDALDEFAKRDERKAELVKLRYFVGVTTEEAADILGISVPTANRWWSYSRAWLGDEIERQRNRS